MVAITQQSMWDVMKDYSESKKQQVFNFALTLREPQELDREARAKKRLELIESKKYVRSRGRSHEEIEADLKEMRSDRL